MRLFIAVDPGAEALQALAQAQRGLMEQIACRRWTEVAGSHLTLHFLGETTDADAQAIDAALAAAVQAVSSFSLALGPPGAFPSLARPRVLWAGVAGDLASLAALHGAVGEALAALGRPPEARPFRPHLTIAREPADPAAAGRAIAGTTLPAMPWRVEEAVLYCSHLGAEGARYEALARHRLGPADASPAGREAGAPLA